MLPTLHPMEASATLPTIMLQTPPEASEMPKAITVTIHHIPNRCWKHQDCAISNKKVIFVRYFIKSKYNGKEISRGNYPGRRERNRL